MTPIVHPGRCEAQLPPASNTGGNSFPPPPTSPCAFVDTLTFTLPIEHLSTDIAVTVMHDSDGIAAAVNDAFLSAFRLELGAPTGQRKNGYVDSAPILSPSVDPLSNGKASLGYVAWGGNQNRLGQDTLCVYLTGAACEHLNLMDAHPDYDVWHGLYLALIRHGAKVTRLDCAYDDLAGSHGGIDSAVAGYHSGAFTIRRPPSVNQQGDWINGHSRTFYIGKRDNGKLIRVYEKGHQLGFPESPWVRYEVELHSKDRVIPLEAILRPSETLAGAAPYLASVLASVKPVPIKTTIKERLRLTIDKLVSTCSTSYGRLVNAMLGVGMTSDQIVSTLRRDGLPSRLYVPPAAVPA